MFVEPRLGDQGRLPKRLLHLPSLEIQEEMLKTIPGFENVEIMRPAMPLNTTASIPLKASLESKEIGGLFVRARSTAPQAMKKLRPGDCGRH